jgi:hypothetical protein
MIGEKKMSKRSINHSDGKKAAKTMANAKEQETVKVEWNKTNIGNFTVRFEEEAPKNAYKLFTELDNDDKGEE